VGKCQFFRLSSSTELEKSLNDEINLQNYTKYLEKNLKTFQEVEKTKNQENNTNNIKFINLIENSLGDQLSIIKQLLQLISLVSDKDNTGTNNFEFDEILKIENIKNKLLKNILQQQSYNNNNNNNNNNSETSENFIQKFNNNFIFEELKEISSKVDFYINKLRFFFFIYI
jgi:hypothetical protein